MSKFAGVEYRLIAMGVGVMSIAGLILLAGPKSQAEASISKGAIPVNLGFFPNVTHAPALIGVESGAFQKALGSGAHLQTKVMNAGPEAMEALLAGDIDVLYVGPSPALNTYLKSEGKALRIVSGVCEGGASLVATAKSGIRSLGDLAGKKVAVPQLGNTQDVSLRRFIGQVGLSPKDRGGSVDIIPVQSADTIALFKSGEIDAAWVPEPWASRLVMEAGAKRVIDERSLWPAGRFTTTVLVARKEFMDQHPSVVQALVQANRDTIDWIAKNPEEAHAAVNRELYELAGKHKAKQVPDQAWQYLTFNSDLDMAAVSVAADSAYACGYLKTPPNHISAIFDPLFLKAGNTRVGR